jgi:hypothetical protein
MKEFLSAHVCATTERAREEPVVLAVQDTTSLNYTGLAGVCEGLGRVGTDESGALGLIVHDTVAFTPGGLPLGVLDAQVWARDTKEKEKSAAAIREKESRKWLVSYERACVLQTECGKRTMVVSVGDREADFYELFCETRDRKSGAQLLVRACQNRSVREECGYLFDHMHGLESGGEYELSVAARHNRRARQATLSVRFAKLVLEAPQGKKDLGPVELYAVLAREEAAPDGEAPLEWLLLTTVAVQDFERARKILSWYTVRWGIEVFHRTLKSGCRIEDRQLENDWRTVWPSTWWWPGAFCTCVTSVASIPTRPARCTSLRKSTKRSTRSLIPTNRYRRRLSRFARQRAWWRCWGDFSLENPTASLVPRLSGAACRGSTVSA